MWKIKHPVNKKYTWVKISDNRVSVARYIDRFISPVGLSDHRLVFI